MLSRCSPGLTARRPVLQVGDGAPLRGFVEARIDVANEKRVADFMATAGSMGRSASETAAALMRERGLGSDDLSTRRAFASLVSEAAAEVARVGMRGALAPRWA